MPGQPPHPPEVHRDPPVAAGPARRPDPLQRHGGTRTRRRWGWTLALVLAVLALAVPLTLARWHEPTPRGTPVNVVVEDFSLRRDVTVVPAGTVRLRILNEGPTTHEVSVVRTDRAPEKLPLQRDGLTINEDAPGMEFVGEAEGINLGARRTLALRLAPGKYVLYCNMEGHYLGGMHAALTVR
jgi:uncharacterized cupredoxin-like copper-binding protein